MVCTLYWFTNCVISSKNPGILVACVFVLELKIHVLFLISRANIYKLVVVKSFYKNILLNLFSTNTHPIVFAN
jgi:hypothetical protein